MIVRILGDGQYELDETAGTQLETMGSELDAAMHDDDQPRLDRALQAIESLVHSKGRRLDVTDLVPSDLTVPHRSATIGELKYLLSQDEGG